MGEKTKHAIPGDIGHFTDKDSLAGQLLDKIDRVDDKLEFLQAALSSMSDTTDGKVASLELEGLAHICQDMSSELYTAHEMICSNYRKKAPAPTPESEEAGANG